MKKLDIILYLFNRRFYKIIQNKVDSEFNELYFSQDDKLTLKKYMVVFYGPDSRTEEFKSTSQKLIFSFGPMYGDSVFIEVVPIFNGFQSSYIEGSNDKNIQYWLKLLNEYLSLKVDEAEYYKSLNYYKDVV